jgi:hypothetical protein
MGFGVGKILIAAPLSNDEADNSMAEHAKHVHAIDRSQLSSIEAEWR